MKTVPVFGLEQMLCVQTRAELGVHVAEGFCGVV